MLRTIMAATAVSALALTSAFAQSTTPAPAPSAATPSTAAVTNANFIARQAPDQWLASKFRGTDVIGAKDEKIGDVGDILFDKNGTIVGYVIGVGGFLGIGSKNVAIAPASFQVVAGKDPSDYKLRLSMTKEELKAAAAFEPYAPPRPTASSNPSPMGGTPTRPSTNKQ
jgi:sporulation protein YlmC with PRC-barrel domain